MMLQGPWIYNFIKNYAPPDFEWGVAPFPSVDPQRLKDVSLVESDVLVIPAGARHPNEAFEFIKYVNTQDPMEKLCLGQRKFSPLRECSVDFLKKHPNPYIDKFIALAKSPNAMFAPQLTTWMEYSDDLSDATGRVWRSRAVAQDALDEVQARQQAALDKRVERWGRLATKLTAQWNKQ
jgi:ABC-type glycerol-3-phosphate transport system substrate-binding protein